uniref:F-box domain-containing protein n=1 Tax=Panagrellus redivivus TaxID=6233 RepID=A0A7E4VLG3_PANRE
MDRLQNADKMPLASLPYNFKWRLFTLAPVGIVRDLAKVFPEVKKIRTFRPKAYDQVFITDNEDVYKWASKETFLTVVFKFFYQYAFGKYVFDGESNVNPVWQTVLRVDDIVSKKRHIHVEDTLILHCDSIDAYKKVIRYISGPYTRLVLHGNINATQIRKITHPGVKKVRINAAIEIPTGQHTKLANFVAKHVCSDDSRYVICNLIQSVDK